MRYFLNILISLLLLSCGTDQITKTYRLTVVNSSGANIVVRGYYSFNDSNTPPAITYFENGEEIIKTFETNSEVHTFADFFEGDSIVVIYNNLRSQSYTVERNCQENLRNPLNNCIYKELEETFNFMEEDYENAAPCEGNCD